MNGQNAPADPTVSILSGAVEGSNVNAVHEMVAMIDMQRQFEMQIKMMKTAEETSRTSTRYCVSDKQEIELCIPHSGSVKPA